MEPKPCSLFIADRIRDLELDCLVLGLGPSIRGWFELEHKPDIRTFGVNDIWQHGPVDDLVIVDSVKGNNRISIGQAGHAHVLRSTPKRLWTRDRSTDGWRKALPNLDIRTIEARKICNFDSVPANLHRDPDGVIDSYKISPSYAVTLAWREGYSRIGVLGVDLLPPDHEHAHSNWSVPNKRQSVHAFFLGIAEEASRQGGLITNLSRETEVPF